MVHRQAAGVILALAAASCAAPPEPPAIASTPVERPVVAEAPPEPAHPVTPIADRYRDAARRIIDSARTDGRAYERLRHLCDVIGPRLSGSAALEEAADWCVETLRADGLDAHKEPVLVPHWVRGEESAEMVAPRRQALHMLGLGNSVGTPPEGVTAQVVVARDFDELDRLGEACRGKIVLFNRPMPPYDPETGARYGATVAYRVTGADRAATYGAVGVLVRSVTATSLSTPHTGTLRYEEQSKAIPAAAISVENAEMLDRLVAAGQPVEVRLTMGARFLEDTISHNVIGELRGSELPDEVVVIGGHLDSWDVGQGAHDDGGPSMAVMDVLRLLRSLGLQPRRTIRVVLFTNEENGLRGAMLYAQQHVGEMGRHVAALEADSGAFRPLGFRNPAPETDRDRRVRAQLGEIASLLDPIGAGRVRDGGGGADIGPMARYGVPQIGLEVKGDLYFDYHHTHADTFDKIDREDIHLCTAAVAVMAYVVADMPQRLGE